MDYFNGIQQFYTNDQQTNQLINYYLQEFKASKVPQRLYQAILKQILQGNKNIEEILKAFKYGGRLKELEKYLKNNNSYQKPEEIFQNQMNKPNLGYRNSMAINQQQQNEEKDFSQELCKMIKSNIYFRNNSTFPEKKAIEIINHSYEQKSQTILWGLVVQQQNMFKGEVILIAQNQYKEAVQINVVGKQAIKQYELPQGYNEQTYQDRMEAIQSVKPGDIIGVIQPMKNLDFQAYCVFEVSLDQLFIVKADCNLDQFFEKYDLSVQQMNQKQKDEDQKLKKEFKLQYQKAQKEIWKVESILYIGNILLKFSYFNEVLKFCNTLTNINFLNVNNKIKSEIYKFYFVCYMRKGEYSEAFKNYQQADELGANLQQHKEEILHLLFRMQDFEGVKKKYELLDQNTKERYKQLIDQTDLILDFKREGKNYLKIIDGINQISGFCYLVQNFYGPIEIRQASLEMGREDKKVSVGRGIFVTKNIKAKQLLWAERDLSYTQKGQNNLITMRSTLKEKIKNDHLLRLRLKYLYRDDPDFKKEIKIPPIDLYREDRFDYNKHGEAIPQISDELLFNIVMSSSHIIYPKLYQNEQFQEEEGLWPIFSFVNHSISNRNIEVKVLNGFLFVFSTKSIRKDSQIFHNYVLNINDEATLNRLMQRYKLPEL